VPNPALPQGECDTIVEQRTLRGQNPEYRVLERYSSDDWRRYRWAYYRMIEKVDAQIGRVLEALESSGQAANTVIVFTSDHGECAGAHGFSEKVVFYEESVRVPFIVAAPGCDQGTRKLQLVNTGIDLVPTLLDFARITPRGTFPGRSLRPLVLREEVQQWRDYIVSQNLMPGARTGVNGRMVRSARFKYCVFDQGVRNESLFDEVNDPLETVNLAYDPAYAAELKHMRTLLRDHAKEFDDDVALACLAAIRAP
jgi:arylsulfatase A-like enzyme